MSETIIQLDHIDITFHQKKRVIEAVKDVSVSINRGDIYGIVGYSGAGKSTLVRVINLLQIPTAGTITIGGQVTFENQKVQLSPAELRQKRQKIGMIFQHFNLMAQKTARQNVAFALRHSDLSKVERAKKVEELLDLVGLSDRADNCPAQLSGGQKQRIAIVRALAMNPDVLLFDEPTSALDPISTSKIEELASDLKSQYTIVMVTHNMQQATRVSDRTAFFLLGELVEMGPTERVFATPVDKRTEDYISGRFG